MAVLNLLTLVYLYIIGLASVAIAYTHFSVIIPNRQFLKVS